MSNLNDESIESVLISSAMYDIETAKKVCLSTKKDWYSIDALQKIYSAIKTEMPFLEKLPKSNYQNTLNNKLIHEYGISSDDIIRYTNQSPIVDIEYQAGMLKNLNRLRQYYNLANNIHKSIKIGELPDVQGEIDKINNDDTQSFKSIRDWREKLKDEKIEIYSLGIDFLDNILNGGIELNQLVLINGDKDAGKTSLALQIIESLSMGHKTCLFNLEFPTKKLIKEQEIKFKKKIHMSAEYENKILDNCFIIDYVKDINDMRDIIIQQAYSGVKFFVIDSQMCLDVPNYKGEEAESKKFQILHELTHRYDIVIFLITQSSKTDNEDPFGSKKGGYYASIMLRIDHSKKDNKTDEINPNERVINVIKNKQTGHSKINFKVNFNCETRLFTSKK